MHISLTNSKLGDKIPSINLPPIITCRADAPCKKDCYACKGNFNYPSVKKSLSDNLKEFVEDNDKFFNDIIDYFNNEDITYKFARWHSSGDIVNDIYFNGMIRVASVCKDTKFLCFTKKFDIVNRYINQGGKIPKNLHIVFSGWDKNFKIDNPYNLPTTYVEFKEKERNCIPEFAIPCTASCKNCKACWALKEGQSVYFKKH